MKSELFYINKARIHTADLEQHKKAAEHQDISKEVKLALSYCLGLGVPKDYFKAAELFKKAAEQQNAIAQAALGLLYSNGDGVTQNDAEAVKFYQRSADQGNKIAQRELAFLYQNGTVVPQSYSKAYWLYKKASEQGDKIAQRELLFLQKEELKVPFDDIKNIKVSKRIYGYADNAAELKTIKFFDDFLSNDWEIYANFHFNGHCPDIVLLSPKRGIAVFEVKHWDLSSGIYGTHKDSVDEKLLGAEIVYNGTRIGIRDPFKQAESYKKEILSICGPYFAGNRSSRPSKNNPWCCVSCGVIFPFSTEQQISDAFEDLMVLNNSAENADKKEENSKYFTVTGKEVFLGQKLLSIFPYAEISQSRFMTPEVYKALRDELFISEERWQKRQPIRLDARQSDLVHTRTENGLRRIKGSAGAGKSIVLANKAALLASEGKRVLILTYNLTLRPYLKDLIIDALQNPQDYNQIGILNFSQWCKEICYLAGREREYHRLFNLLSNKENRDYRYELSQITKTMVPSLTKECIELLKEKEKNFSYLKQKEDSGLFFLPDAILVDEGQDWCPEWWNIARKALSDDGEMILFADQAQDLYGNNESWTEEAMKNCGFVGRWVELSVSYRLPPDFVPFVRTFGQKFLPNYTESLPVALGQMDMFEKKSKLRWVQISEKSNSAQVCIDEIKRLMSFRKKADPSLSSDICMLVPTRDNGKNFLKELQKSNLPLPMHTFGSIEKDDEDDYDLLIRDQKLSFSTQISKSVPFKITTIHNFKGWQSPFIILYFEKGNSVEQKTAIYTALTRLKRHKFSSALTVICRDPYFKDYGRAFDNYEEIIA